MDEESVRRGASDGMYSWLNTYEGNAAVVAGVKEAISGLLAEEGSVVIGQVVREYLDENGLGGNQT